MTTALVFRVDLESVRAGPLMQHGLSPPSQVQVPLPLLSEPALPRDRLVSERGSQGAPASRHKVKDQDDDRHNNQKMNQAAANMERKAQ